MPEIHSSERLIKRIEILDLFHLGVRSCSPAPLLDKFLANRPLCLPNNQGHFHLIALGKAAAGMAEGILPHLPQDKVKNFIIVCPDKTQVNPDNCPFEIQFVEGGHPVPNSNSLAAGKLIADALKRTEKDDHIISLISGGGSALAVLPSQFLTFEQKITAYEQILISGLNIREANIVRQQLSLLKGGGFVELSKANRLTSYIFSDVVQDDLKVVASGPTMPPIASSQEAYSIIKNTPNLSNVLPPKLIKHLISSKTNCLNSNASWAYRKVENHLVASNQVCKQSILAASLAASQYYSKLHESPITGNVQIAAENILDIINQSSNKTSNAKPRLFIFGGETTVVVKGNGIGGRNQELAIRFAALAKKSMPDKKWIFLSAGTDGIDGPTDSAGAVVDYLTLERIKQKGLDITQILNNNDSYSALEASEDHIFTGNTGTNVADIQLFLQY